MGCQCSQEAVAEKATEVTSLQRTLSKNELSNQHFEKPSESVKKSEISVCLAKENGQVYEVSRSERDANGKRRVEGAEVGDPNRSWVVSV